MKLNRKLAVLAILGMTGLFANGVSNVNTLVNKINTTKDVKERGILLKKLDKELSTMDKKELPAAQEIVNSKLKLSKVMEK
ncbi:type III restriction system endonuclease, putative [Arcobacter nitrofigilis DSM 7299]|uniref:Type III restriction system endonuclease, putative n=1 Tax=Arcobacter nitrofigilis (strain ATCC 33309 / DSM 7299 / CCUG 15893 / LMG 7604 / NCTC 12251 / CI) TaxID=572480 RepID=D5V0K7_ARCNC|nr:hypothetical protein [Arcobacter nitrofigilis]ADG93819.1 type III restriction system endonuclease, putative [Arcobacter nitrofigilis DSM 7299]